MELCKIINARETLASVLGNEGIGTHLSYWIVKFIVKTEEEYKFYMSELNTLLAQYGQEDDSGKITVPYKKLGEFNNKIENLNKTDVEDPGIRFSLSELSTEIQLSMKQVYSLLEFIDDHT